MVLQELFFYFFVVLTSVLHALLEIQIEGRHGWAEKLPTKKFRNFVITRLSEHSYITGFHLATTLFIIVVSHFPIFFITQWTWGLESIVWSFIVLHITLEDFFWFLLNPHYGIAKFTRQHIWWHKRWFLGLPIGYWIGIPVGMALLVLGTQGQ